jgi:hypothetical protein
MRMKHHSECRKGLIWQIVTTHTVLLEYMIIIHLINKFLVVMESTGPCEHGNNPVGSGTRTEFLGWLNDCLKNNSAPCSQV